MSFALPYGLAALLPLFQEASLAAPDPASLAPLLEQDALNEALERLAAEHAELVTLLEVGTSRGGRTIRALRLAAGEVQPGRPAILVVANLDGPLVYTSGVAVQHARDLAARYSQDVSVQHLLDTTTLYIVPRANPDGAQARFETPLVERWATGHGIDDDRDGRAGEDGPADVDGDGVIEQMRVPDPEGRWIADPTDARATREADAARGEPGTWKYVREARDADGDQEAGEDPQADAEVNRNFAHAFEEHTARAGLYPGAEPEVRALYDFVLARPDIQLVVAYGQLDSLVDPPKGVADDAPARMRVPPPGVRESDAKLLAELGRRYRELSQNRSKGTGDAAGTFQDWAYGHRGLLTLALRLWDVPTEERKQGGERGKDDEPPGEDDASDGEDTPAPIGPPDPIPPTDPDVPTDPDLSGETQEPAETGQQAQAGQETEKREGEGEQEQPKPGEEAKRLTWIDSAGESEAWRFRPWTSFEHPELGPVEIGGLAPYATLEPPQERRAQLAEEHLAFLVSLADVPARLAFADVTRKELGAGLVEVRAFVHNSGLLPLFTRSGELARSQRPARVRIELPEGASLVAGDRQALVSDLPGAGGRIELRWLVQGASPTDVVLTLDSDHAGTDRQPGR